MRVLDRPVWLDFTPTGAAPPSPAAGWRRFAIEAPQRATAPFIYGHVTLMTDAEGPPAATGPLFAGPFAARRGWAGAPDEHRYSHLLIALTNARDGQEEAFDSWYWDRHFLDGLALPGCYAGCRFALADDGAGPFRHLALYQFDIPDIGTVVDAHIARAGTPQMPITDAISPVFEAWYVRPLGEWGV